MIASGAALHLAVAAAFCQITGAVSTTADGKIRVDSPSNGGMNLPAVDKPVTITVRAAGNPTLVTLSVVEYDPNDEREVAATRKSYPMTAGEGGVWSAAVEVRPGKAYRLTAAASRGQHVWRSGTILLGVSNN